MSTDTPLFLGLDIGTSGARVSVIDAAGAEVAAGRAAMADQGTDHRDPAVWWRAAERALDGALADGIGDRVVAVAIDGTSGTMLPVDPNGQPLSPGRMYNDVTSDSAILDRVGAHAPAESGAHGATSGLAKAIELQTTPGCAGIVHQADWIASRLSGQLVSDENNALKTGYDPVAGKWPDWIAATGMEMSLLPKVVPPGTAVARVTGTPAERFGISPEAIVVAGTTDGCASFLATGAAETGDGVTALGTTLTLKLLSDRPVFAPEFGVYSHKVLGMWLAGGASNSGGNVLLAHFDAERIAGLSVEIDPEADSGLDYYPLKTAGERFPVADAGLAPKLVPRPESDSAFLHGLLDGIAGIEALGYQRLADLGAPALRSVRSVGGGAGNPVWTRIRERRLGVPFVSVASEEAAYGAALLARHGAGVR